MAKKRKDNADEIWEAVQARVQTMIENGHPAAVECGWDKGRLTTWYLTHSDEGRRLREEYKTQMHYRHGGRAETGPPDPADGIVTEDGHYGPAGLKLTDRDGGELGSSRRFGEPTEGGSESYAALFKMAEEIHKETPDEDFNSVFLAVCKAEKLEAKEQGREPLLDRHYRERAEAIRRRGA